MYFLAKLIHRIPWFRREIEVDQDHIIARTKEGWPIVLNKHDRCVCRHIRLGGIWEQDTHDCVLNLIREGDIVIEVGANYGIHLVSMAKAVGPQGQVIAYEANPSVFDALKRTISLNNLENITYRNCAIGHSSSTAVLNFNLRNIGGGAIDFKGSQGANNECTKVVQVKSLDEDTEGLSNVSLLRMDIEGSEGLALYGAEKLIDRSPNLKIVVEWAPELLQKNSKPEEILQFLTRKGFAYYYTITAHGLKEVTADQLVHTTEADDDVLITRTPFRYSEKRT